MWAAFGILAAYIHREKTGEGQEVDMSLFEAGLSLMFSPVAMHFYAKGDWAARNRRNDANAPAGFFKTKDESYVAVFASYPALWDRFIAAMNLQHLAEDPRFASRKERTANSPALHDLLGEIFLKEDTQHWVDLFNKAGVPAAPVANVGQVLNNEQALARDMVVEQEHPTAGKITVVGVPVKLSSTPGRVNTPAPLLGENTEEIISSLGHADRMKSLKEAGVI
jgi:crotonobetainyl-CoA:carnitine CoA-transferase CaiB-like acyl-CoA transferase